MMRVEKDVSQWRTVSGVLGIIERYELKPTPFIVDIGASDIKINSNNYNFINNFGWGAILVEPNPKKANLLREFYEANNKVKVVEAAISGIGGPTTLYLPPDESDDQLASLIKYDDRHNSSVQVKCLMPKDLPLPENIGILTIDTEGIDVSVVKAWFKAELSKPTIIITESWPHLFYDNLEKATILGKNGYRRVAQFGENDVFVLV